MERKTRRSAGRPDTASQPDLGQALKELTEGMAKGAVLFPHGITKISLTIKVGGNEVSCDIEGPQSTQPGGEARELRLSPPAAPDVVFTITQRIGKKARGRLVWASKGLSSPAVSGDSAHDAINVGTWTGITFMERPGDPPYCDPSGHCWFSVFKDAYQRTDMGIHPDGGVRDATLGCIGLSDNDTTPWHDALNAVQGQIVCQVVEGKELKIKADDHVLERT